jgi:4-oxalocrotonate tautomerase
MPVLRLHLSARCVVADRRGLAAELVALTASVLHKRPELTALLIHEQAETAWSIGAAEPQRPTALLEIDITAGSNSAEEKADFVARAFECLQQRTAGQGDLETASYVIVRELPGEDWGYGGVTQAERRVAQSAAGLAASA